MITSAEQLQNLVEKAKATDAVAIDTEFIWTRTYYPRLGLIQLALSDEDCFLIDPLAIEDLSPFGELLSDQRVVKIFHDAPQDLAILHRATGKVPKNIFDTRLAAGFAGLPSTLSLGNLIQELLDIKLAKTQTRTNWLKRPLDPKQIQYGMDDVRYLRAARIILINRIIGPEIKAWLRQELDTLNKPLFYNGINGSTRYQKIRGVKGLDRRKLAVMKELTLWREQEAKTINRPRGHVVTDSILLEIVRKKLDTLQKIAQETDISERKIALWGEAIIDAVEKGRNTPENQLPQLQRSTRLNRKETETLDRLNEFIRLKSKVQGIDPALIGNNSELRNLVKFPSNTSEIQVLRQMDGWRKIFLKDFLRYSL